MYSKTIAMFAVISLGLAPTAAQACEYDMFLFQLPGETKAVAEKRSVAIHEDYRVKEHFDREKRAFEAAKLIYLARVVSRTNDVPGPDRIRGPSTKVRPITAFRGTLPSTDSTLLDEGQGGMCIDIGDGRGAAGWVGDLIVVFEGLPTAPDRPIYANPRPRGIDSFNVSSIRTIELLDWLRDYGTDLE